LKTGKLVFLYDFLQENKKRIFRVDSHPQALKAVIEPPQEMELGQPNTFVIHVSSGRNKVSEASLSLYAASEGISLLKVPALSYTKGATNAAKSPSQAGEVAFDTYEAIALPAFGPTETIAVTVPYETSINSSEHMVKMAVQYLTPNARRHTFTLTSGIEAILPLQVSHSIIWRDDW
jgi:hypothetical protein